jgi:hypothetical protein
VSQTSGETTPSLRLDQREIFGAQSALAFLDLKDDALAFLHLAREDEGFAEAGDVEENCRFVYGRLTTVASLT